MTAPQSAGNLYDILVVRFADRRIPAELGDLPVGAPGDAVAARRVVVVGDPSELDADLATVLTALLRAGRLDVEVAPLRRTGARRARTGAAQRTPLIRDETGQVIVGSARWLPPAGERTVHGEAVVDDAVLFDGDVPEIEIRPTAAPPGLRARVRRGPLRRGPWVSGRAAQLGTTGARVVRDGVEAPRPVRRSTFYRNTEGWLLVR